MNIFTSKQMWYVFIITVKFMSNVCILISHKILTFVLNTNLFLIQIFSWDENTYIRHEFCSDNQHISHLFWCECTHIDPFQCPLIKLVKQNKFLLFLFHLQNFIISHISQLTVAITFDPGSPGISNLGHCIYHSSRDVYIIDAT